MPGRRHVRGAVPADVRPVGRGGPVTGADAREGFVGAEVRETCATVEREVAA